MADEGLVLAALVVLEALLDHREIEAANQLAGLPAVVLQTDRETIRMGDLRDPAVEAKLVPSGQWKPVGFSQPLMLSGSRPSKPLRAHILIRARIGPANRWKRRMSSQRSFG